MGPDCPRCALALVPARVAGERLWVCTACDGRGVRARTLERCAARETTEFVWRQVAAKFTVVSELACPWCARALRTAKVPLDEAIEVDACVRCRIVWFDRGEFASTRRATLVDPEHAGPRATEPRIERERRGAPDGRSEGAERAPTVHSRPWRSVLEPAFPESRPVPWVAVVLVGLYACSSVAAMALGEEVWLEWARPTETSGKFQRLVLSTVTAIAQPDPVRFVLGAAFLALFAVILERLEGLRMATWVAIAGVVASTFAALIARASGSTFMTPVLLVSAFATFGLIAWPSADVVSIPMRGAHGRSRLPFWWFVAAWGAWLVITAVASEWNAAREACAGAFVGAAAHALSRWRDHVGIP